MLSKCKRDGGINMALNLDGIRDAIKSNDLQDLSCLVAEQLTAILRSPTIRRLTSPIEICETRPIQGSYYKLYLSSQGLTEQAFYQGSPEGRESRTKPLNAVRKYNICVEDVVRLYGILRT
jgi:hypothetical protein